MSATDSKLFDVEPHGTPCLICGQEACVCRAGGALEAQPGAWPIDRPTDSERERTCVACPCGNLVRPPFTYCGEATCLGARP